jgi:hypothetical protein
MSNNPNQSITIPIDDLLSLALGHELSGCCPIPLQTAIILHELTKNGTLYRVQFDEFDGSPLLFPKLWSYNEWHYSRENYDKNKVWQHKLRVERWILEANVRMIGKALSRFCNLDTEVAEASALSLLRQKNMNKLRAIGVTKLIEKEEEL